MFVYVFLWNFFKNVDRFLPQKYCDYFLVLQYKIRSDEFSLGRYSQTRFRKKIPYDHKKLFFVETFILLINNLQTTVMAL